MSELAITEHTVDEADRLDLLSLDELEVRIRSEHDTAIGFASRAVEHAIGAGLALLEARKRVEPGSWLKWVEALDLGHDQCSRYMRLATYRTELTIADGTTLKDALSQLTGLPPVTMGTGFRYDPALRRMAKNMYQQGRTLTEIANELGPSVPTIHRWLHPEEARRRKNKKQQQYRAAKKALEEQERQRARARAARDAGGAIDRAYSQLRLHIEALDQAMHEATDRAIKARLREALEHAYKAEDKIAEALKVS